MSCALQVFPDASSLAQAACRAAYACSPGADWDLLQRMMDNIQGALDAGVPSSAAPAKAAAEHEEALEGWDDADEASSGPAMQAKPEPSSIPLKMQLQRVHRLATAAFSCY